jgi:hypothetical protein
MSAMTSTQASILTFTPAADGFGATSWNVIRTTFPLTSTRSAGGLSRRRYSIAPEVANYDW